MPSLWKKAKGKPGGSLVVEAGFSTSLVDFFVKNRYKLKKPKTKKHKSNKLTTISEDDDSDHQKRSVNHPPVDNFEKNVVNNDFSVEKLVAHQTSVAEIQHDCGENEEGIKEIAEGSRSKKSMVLLSILMGVLFLILVLYAQKWVLGLITLGILMLFLLIYLGNGVSKWILKGGLIVIVALYTKWLVVVITIGASLLILGNSILGFFNPCQDYKDKLQEIFPNWGDSNKQWSKEEEFEETRRKEERGGISTKEVRISSKSEVRGNHLVSRRDFFQELAENEAILRAEIEQDNDNSSSIFEPLVPESNDPNYPKSSDFIDLIGYIDLRRVKGAKGKREKVVEDDKLLNHHGKPKKEKKFWKKLVHKKKKPKRKKHDHRGQNSDLQSEITQDNAAELGEEDEDESEISEERLSTSTSTSRSGSTLSLNDEIEAGIDKFELANICITEMLQLENRNSKAVGVIKEGYGSMKYLTAMAVPLTGLLGGRLLAVFVTVISCLVLKFKMART